MFIIKKTFKELCGKKGSSSIEIIIWLSIVLVISTTLFTLKGSMVQFLNNANEIANKTTSLETDETENNKPVETEKLNPVENVVNKPETTPEPKVKEVKEVKVVEKVIERVIEKEVPAPKVEKVGFFESFKMNFLSDILAGICMALITYEIRRFLGGKRKDSINLRK